MASSDYPKPFESLADLLERLGGISPERVVLKPPPGKATEAHLQRALTRTDRLFELVDGTLVEKVCNYPDSALTCDIVRLLGKFLDEHDLGALAGPDGFIRLRPGLVRAPDISFVPWVQLPGHVCPTEPFPDLVPELAIEILSEGSPDGEMKRKRAEFFLAGTSLYWFVDRLKRTVQVFTAPDVSTLYTEDEILDGGSVLPGLCLPVRDVFAKVPRTAGRNKPARRRKPRA
jgi:Uma2 family endonuclease